VCGFVAASGKIKVEDKTLLLGEGSFSFAKSLAEKTDESKRGMITATTLDNLNQLSAKAKANIEALERMGAIVKGGVDARNISGTLDQGGFNSIIWNFPRVIVPRGDSHKIHRDLLRDFFKSASSEGLLQESGKIYATLKDTPYYKGWRIDKLAAEYGFIVVKTYHQLYQELKAAYPGYEHTKTDSDKPILQDGDPTITYVFQRKTT
jgi:25S rRNA (uracil2634-N3)-methyltransferase